MSQTSLEKLDQYIATLERRTEDARRIRTILAASPELAEALISTLQATPPPAPLPVTPTPPLPLTNSPPEEKQSEGPTEAAPSGGPTAQRLGGPTSQRYYDQIAGALRASGNQWKTVEQIMRDTDLSRNAVIHILYKTHSNRFNKTGNMHGQRGKVWRLDWRYEKEPKRPAADGESPPITQPSGAGRMEQLTAFLQQHGPMGRKEIIRQTGIPEGTIAGLLQEGPFVRDNEKRWNLCPGQNGAPHKEEAE